MDRLAIFDVDGTLTDTNAVDAECFLRALAEELGVEQRQIIVSGAPHMTDSAIAHWAWRERHGAAPDERAIARVRDRFVGLLEAALAAEVGAARFACVPGAPGVFARLRGAGWASAIATGGWSHSARLKLEAAGVLELDVPLACADDAHAREDIVRAAWQRAEKHHARSFVRVVSVGDASWDVRTAAALRMPFLGVARGRRAERLREAGATTILPDLADWERLLEALDTASIPSLTAARAAT